MSAPMIYELRRPKNYDQNKKYPAIFMMHGIGSNEKNMLSLTAELEDKFYIFSIRGHLPQPPGYSFFTIEAYGKPHRDVFDQGIDNIINFIDYATENYNVDNNHLYLLGFSQGAILAKTLGLVLGNKLKGIVALSGYIPKFVKEEYNIMPVTQLSVFISHGQFDNVLPYEWGVKSSEFFKELGADVTLKSYQEGHTVSMQNHEDFVTWILNDLQK
ncbi:alpha/beta hydrolase [Schinkia sp. CFF1]